LRFSTFVVDETVRGGVPVETNEVNVLVDILLADTIS
jgi:hypothetical protein